MAMYMFGCVFGFGFDASICSPGSGVVGGRVGWCGIGGVIQEGWGKVGVEFGDGCSGVGIASKECSRAAHSKMPITVTTIEPGFVKTPMVEGQPLWMASVERAVTQMVRAINNKKNHTTRASLVRVSGMVLEHPDCSGLCPQQSTDHVRRFQF